MATVILVEVTPWTPDTRTATPIRLAGGGSRRGYTYRGYNDWLAGILAVPRFTAMLGFDENGWTGGAIPQTAAINFAPSNPAVLSALSEYVWAGAAIEIRTGDDALANPEWTLELKGTVAGLAIKGGAMSLTVSDLSGSLADAFLVARFAGTGGIEGTSDAKDRIKRRTFGACFNVEGRLLHKAKNIWEFGDPAFQLQDLPVIKDRGRAYTPVVTVAWQGSVGATFAALDAATAPNGGIVKAPSIACAKPWTVPAGPLTADILGEIGAGYVDTAAEIAQRIVSAKSALVVANVVQAKAARGGAAGLHIDNEGDTTAQLLDRLLFGVSLVWVLDPDGTIRLCPATYADPVTVIEAIEIEREAVYKAVSARVLGYQRNHRIHTDGEISAVFMASDGTYADGTPIEDLRPAEAGANVTASHNAAGIYGQGALATMSSVGYGTPYATGFGGLAPLNYTTIGNNIRRADGTTTATEGMVITSLGTASAIAGQGSLATLSSLAYGSSYLTGFGALAALAFTTLGTNVRRADGTTVATEGMVVTSLGTASAIAGQGSLATLSSLAYGSSYLVGFGALAALAFTTLGTNVRRADGATVATDAMLVTSLGVAASIFGQGWAATASEAQTSNALVPTGVNTLVNSSFQRGTFGWRINTATLGVNYPGYYGRRNVAYMSYPGTLASGTTLDAAPYGQWLGNSTSEMRSYCLPVVLGQKVGCRALVAAHRCTAELYILAFDMNGGLLAAPFTSTGYITGGAYQGDSMGEMSQTYTVDNANVAFVQFMLRMRGTGESDPYVFFAEPWLGKLSAGQSVIPAYAPGPPDFAADRTLDNTAASIVGQGALATVSQVTAGYLSTGVVGQDMLLNGGAEAGMDGWIPSFWFDAGSTATSYAAANPKSGSKVFRLLKTNTGNSSSIRSKAIPVTPGKLYVFRGSAIGSAATAGGLYIRLYMGNNVDGAGYLTASDYLVSAAENAPFTTSWATFERSISIPSGYRYVEFHFLNYASGPLEAWGDDFQVYEQTTAGLLTSNAVQLGLNITRADGGTSLTDAMAVTSLGVAASIFGQGVLATLSLITSQYLRPGVASDNLIPNADFADGNVKWAITTATYATAGNNPWPAKGAVYISNGTTGYVDANNGAQIFSPYQRIHMSAWFFAVAGTAAGQLQAYCYQPDGTFLSALVVPITLPAAGAWYHAGGWLDLPAGTAQVIFRWTMTNTSGQPVYMTGMRAAPTEYGGDVTINAQFLVDMAKTVEISFDYTGTTASGLPRPIPVTVTKGGVNVTTDNAASYSVSNFTGGCTNANVTIDNTNGASTKGRATIVNGTAAPGTFDWIMTYNGQQVAKVTVAVTKKVADAPAGSGSGSGGYTKSGTFDAGGQGIGSTTLAEFGRVSNITVAAGESLYASFSSTYYVSGTGNFVSRYMVGKFQRSPAGANSWTDFAGQVSGTNAQTYNINNDQYPGTITINQTAATPGAGTYDVRLVLAESSTANASVISTETPSQGSVIAKA